MHDELTSVDIKKMQDEIDERIQRRSKLREEMELARRDGDLSENFPYHSAKSELRKNQSRIDYLKKMIETAIVIDVESDNDKIGLFDKVVLFYEMDQSEREIHIVTTLRQDAMRGYISKESAFGKALLGHKVGDRVAVSPRPDFTYYVVVRSIEKGVDDDTLEISPF